LSFIDNNHNVSLKRFSVVSLNGLRQGVSLLLALVLLVGLVSCTPLLPFSKTDGLLNAVVNDEKNRALSLYDEAWQTVHMDYVDPTFNGQNWSQWRHKYDGVIQTADDAYVAIETMLASLNDDYTRFLPPREMTEQNLQIDARLFGIGIQIMQHDKKLTVVSTLAETPAEEAGLKPLDWIAEIEGESTAGMDVQQAADRIRGPEGSTVKLTITRGDQTFTKTIRRARITIKTVFIKPVSDTRVGYIRLNSFISETALQEMVAALKKLDDKKALILDLRGNYGGLLNNAVDIADLFLRDEAIVSIKGRYDRQTRRFYGRVGNETLKPLVVLIDEGSASASEILSGALKDNHRAKLIGARTFGKGLVQKITPLENGSGINITISKYFTPNGRDIHKHGIPPDIAVSLTKKAMISGDDVQLKAAVQYLNRRLSLSAHPKSQRQAG